MSLSTLLYKLQPELAQQVSALPAPWPSYNLFFSICDSRDRAIVVNASGDSLEEAWEKGAQEVQRIAKRQKLKVCWLKVDWTKEVVPYTWKSFKEEIARTKRNYYRFGISLDSELKYAFLEQEINANAMLYLGGKFTMAELNEKNFTKYAHNRFSSKMPLDFSDEQAVFRLNNRGMFCALGEGPQLLYGVGRNAGRRIIHQLDEQTTEQIIRTSSDYLTRQVKKNGRFEYGVHPCFDRPINTYNTLRHASSTYAMLEGWEVTQDPALLKAIKRSLRYLKQELIKTAPLDTGETAAFLTDLNDEIKLGGNAVCLLAFTKYTELMEEDEYLPLLEQLALGIRYMQNQETGRFVHVLNYPDLSVKEEFRTIYYAGEAAFGLMRLYGLTKDERWLAIVEKAFDHFIAEDYWQAHDHWLSYCVNELTLYRPEERYYRFGIKNFIDHLDFVTNRITTFPTLLELMMAAHKMIGRMQQQPELQHLVDEIDLNKFDHALQSRAQYLMNGYFWPEYAMYFKKPSKIVGSCYIRHHSFRVRIDDVEHYLSGYVAYLHYYLQNNVRKENPPNTAITASEQASVSQQQVTSKQPTSSEAAVSEQTAASEQIVCSETSSDSKPTGEQEQSERPAEAVSSPAQTTIDSAVVANPSVDNAVVNSTAAANSTTLASTSLSDQISYTEGPNWTTARLLQATKGQWLNKPDPRWRSTGLCIHAPTFKPGHMIVLRPEDDKRFIPLDKLAELSFFPQALITQEELDITALKPELPVLKVNNLDKAIIDIGRYARSQIKGKVIGVTGSSGKTTTVAMLNQALKPYGPTAQTAHNANLPRGIAWNLASTPWDSDFVILELAIGGMIQNAEMVRPDIAVFTNVAPAHLQYHNNTEEIAYKKSQIFSYMEPGSHAIINRDMQEWDIVEQAAQQKALNIISFGQHTDSDIRLIDMDAESGKVTADLFGERVSFIITTPGIHMALNALICLAVTHALQLEHTPARAMLSLFKAVSGRGDLQETVINQSLVQVINDAYNANPASMKAALQAFQAQKSPGRKILVLGDMLELAHGSEGYHQALAGDIANSNADHIFLMGEEMAKIAPTLKEKGISCSAYTDLAELTLSIENQTQNNDLILFKSSNGIGLQRVIKKLTQSDC